MTCTAGCIVVSVKTGHALPPLWPVRPVAKSAGCKCDFPGELHAGPTEAAGSPTLVILPSRLVTEMRFSNFRRKAVLILTLRNVRLRTARALWLVISPSAPGGWFIDQVRVSLTHPRPLRASVCSYCTSALPRAYHGCARSLLPVTPGDARYGPSVEEVDRPRGGESRGAKVFLAAGPRSLPKPAHAWPIRTTGRPPTPAQRDVVVLHADADRQHGWRDGVHPRAALACAERALGQVEARCAATDANPRASHPRSAGTFYTHARARAVARFLLRTAPGRNSLSPPTTAHFHHRRRPSPPPPAPPRPAAAAPPLSSFVAMYPLAVLQDVIRTMYNPKFIAELFRGQDVYNMQSTRQIFDKLAHSSIMRLNESSMDKARPPAQPPLAAPNPGGCHVWGGARPGALSPSHAACSHTAPRHTLRPATPRFLSQLFDLMTMGFKYQLIACRYPQELLHVTLNHLHQAPPHPPPPPLHLSAPPLCTRTALALHWHCTGTTLALHWHCTGTARLRAARHRSVHPSAPLGALSAVARQDRRRHGRGRRSRLKAPWWCWRLVHAGRMGHKASGLGGSAHSRAAHPPPSPHGQRGCGVGAAPGCGDDALLRASPPPGRSGGRGHPLHQRALLEHEPRRVCLAQASTAACSKWPGLLRGGHCN